MLSALYSACVYLFCLVTLLYAIGFVEGAFVPKSIDSGDPGALLPSLAINLALLGVFAVQHSLMARPAFKRVWTRLVPEPVERSTYVLFASLALALLFWAWRPVPQLVWDIQGSAADVVQGLSYAGWTMVLLSTFMISHFHLFGLSQGLAGLKGREQPEPEFTTPMFYRFIRHPIYAGFIIAFWATPQMSLGHLVFALATTGYIFVGIWFEERDLIAQHGLRYLQYRMKVGMLVPRLRPRPYPAVSEVKQGLG
jgi:protein-S-isoprenylcysteine O-methyltransferase Ste14